MSSLVEPYACKTTCQRKGIKMSAGNLCSEVGICFTIRLSHHTSTPLNHHDLGDCVQCTRTSTKLAGMQGRAGQGKESRRAEGRSEAEQSRIEQRGAERGGGFITDVRFAREHLTSQQTCLDVVALKQPSRNSRGCLTRGAESTCRVC